MSSKIIMSFDITKKCTMNCLHCYNMSGKDNEGLELDDKHLTIALNKILTFQPDILCLCGGEPFLRFSLIKNILKGFPNINTAINIVSNGILINNSAAKDIFELGFNAIQISLDGYFPETHDWLRQTKGAYIKTLEAIKLLTWYNNRYNNKVKIVVSFCLNKKNYLEVIRCIHLCENLGVDLFKIQPLMLLGRGEKNKHLLALTSAEIKQVKKCIRKEICNSFLKMQIELSDPYEALLLDNIDVLNIHIDSVGNICLNQLLPIIIGNIFENKLEKYLNKELIQDYWGSDITKNLRYTLATKNSN